MIRYIKAGFLALSLGMFACEESSSEGLFNDRPVVESVLHPGREIEVNVDRLIAFIEDPEYGSDDINSLSLTLSTDAQDFPLYPLGEGNYTDSSQVTITAGGWYSLKFQYNGEEVVAETVIPAKPIDFVASDTEIEITAPTGGPGSGGTFPEPIELSWTNDDNSYYLVVVENTEDDPEAIFETEGDDAPPPRFFRNEPFQSNVFEINARQFQYYGAHRIVLFHINAEYVSLYSDNGSNSQNLTEPNSNVVNGYGIFTGINSDTLALEVKAP